jgi:hypothetical protein
MKEWENAKLKIGKKRKISPNVSTFFKQLEFSSFESQLRDLIDSKDNLQRSKTRYDCKLHKRVDAVEGDTK